MAAEDARLTKAREELSRLDAETRALAFRVAAGDNEVRAQLNAAIRRSNAGRALVGQLESEDRRGRGIPDPPMPMYGPPPVRRRSGGTTESDAAAEGSSLARRILDRLFGRSK